VNAQKWEDIGNQRGAMLPLGVWAIRGDREKADAQWRAVEVGFQHQESDGRFAGSRTPSSIAFFFCELCDALLLVRASPLADAYEERIAALLPKIRLGVQRMHAERDKLWRFDIHAPNRLLFTAQAFGLSGLLLDDKELLALANDFAMAALSFQRKSDGVFLENFGPDTSYHAVCLLRAQVYGFFFPQKRIDEAMEKGIAWERSRILPTGEVDVTGNVRTGLGQEVYHGKPKGVNYGEVVLALLYYAARTGDSGTLADARRIAAYRYRTPV
jgi:hypothetical protein